jgi:hypothetical protein
MLIITLNIKTSGQSLRIKKKGSGLSDMKHWKGKYFHIMVCGLKVLKFQFELNLVSLKQIYNVKVMHKCFCGAEISDFETVAAMSGLRGIALFRCSVPSDFTGEKI